MNEENGGVRYLLNLVISYVSNYLNTLSFRVITCGPVVQSTH